MRASVAVEALARARRVAMRLYGASMVGTIWPGDVVVFERCKVEQVRVGQVVLYRREGRLVAHRVMEISRASGKTWLVTRGDALRGDDLPVRGEDVLGQAILLQREGRTAGSIAWQRSTMQALLGGIVARSALACQVVLRARALYVRAAACIASIPRGSRKDALEISS